MFYKIIDNISKMFYLVYTGTASLPVRQYTEGTNSWILLTIASVVGG